MYYLYEGLYFEDGGLKKATIVTPHAYTEDLDRYYDFLAKRVSSGEKPKIRISDEYKDFIIALESTGKYGFTRVTTTLLDFSSEMQQEILGNIKKMRETSLRDNHDHDFTMLLKEFKRGVMFSVAPAITPEYLEKMDHHCKLKMYQTRFDEWIIIYIDLSKEGSNLYDFRIYNDKWKYDMDMERRLERYKAWKMIEHNKSGKKIGRNDPCPCNSGLKYKKCCGK
jgi:hypothetical protein